MPDSRPSPRRGEEGYVLLAAIWLLILAGSIAALLMSRSVLSATHVKDVETALNDKAALEGAIHTVLADRLVNGPRSSWWVLPAEGAVELATQQIRVRISNESSRLDLNAADIAVIDEALQGFEVPAAARARVAGALATRRAAKQPLTSFEDVAALLAGITGPDGACLQDHVTISSGQSRPRSRQMTGPLADALGVAVDQVRSIAEPGASLRVEAAAPSGSAMMLITRVAVRGEPLLISEWKSGPLCTG